MACPACSSTRSTPFEGMTQVETCSDCGAIFGKCYKGDASLVRLPFWHEGPSSPEEERYFDLTLLGSEGIERVHGWFNIRTKRITQTG